MNLVALFTANFPKRSRALCPRTASRRDEESKRNNNVRRGNKRTRGRAKAKENGVCAKGTFTRGGWMKRKGDSERERAAGVFAIIIIAGFLPRMLRKQQVAALARTTRTRGQIVRDNDKSQSKSGD